MDDSWDPVPNGSYNAGTLQPDDPLRSWAANLTPEELSHLAAGNDPQVAIDRLISRGVPPPPSQIMSFADPAGNNIDPVSGMPTKADGTPFPVFKGGKLQGNLTSDQGTPPTEAPTAPIVAPKVASPPASFDPEPETPAAGGVPLPRERPAEAGPGASDISAQKRQKTTDALDGFSKSLAGVKAPTAPPLNAVGTPGAPHANAMPAANIAQLLSVIGQSSRPNAIQTLGRLLVAGKA